MPNAKKAEDCKRISRRAALARLGIASGMTYATPSLLRIDRKAQAEVLPSDCPPPPLPQPPHCPPNPPGPAEPPA